MCAIHSIVNEMVSMAHFGFCIIFSALNLLYPKKAFKAVLYSILLLLRLQQVGTPLSMHLYKIVIEFLTKQDLSTATLRFLHLAWM